jgi:hypothetical protein
MVQGKWRLGTKKIAVDPIRDWRENHRSPVENAMNDTVDTKKVKDRSPNFPFISLEAALDRVRQFYAEEKRGVAPYSRIVMHWKYSPNSSGGLQTVAALKSYGLLAEIGGSGNARQFQLTELALRIILDTRPDSEERMRYIAEAALKPSVAATVHANWPDGLPSDSTINHFLVLELRFNEPSAIKAVKILKENQEFASLDAFDIGSQLAKIESEVDMETKPTQSPAASKAQSQSLGPTARFGTPAVVQARPPVAFGGGSAMFTESVLLPSGAGLTILFTEPPDIKMYKQLQSFLKWKLSLFDEAEGGPSEAN